MNENITVQQWTVHYVNGGLHFSKTVNGIAVYTLNGALVAQFAGQYTNVPVSLASGIYIVQAGGRSAKLFVGSSKGSPVAPFDAEIKTAVSTPAQINLRSESSIKTYWNITANSSTVSIKNSDVEKFSFKADNSLVFTLKNRSTVELSNYNGVEFTIEPVEPTTDAYWDLERTFAIGGGAYGYDSNLDYPASYKTEFISAISQTDIILYDVVSDKESMYARSEISSNLLNRDNAQVSFCTIGNDIFPAISYYQSDNAWLYGGYICFQSFINNNDRFGAHVGNYNFNGRTNKISTTFKIDKDGNLVATYKNADGVSRSHTFRK